MTVTNLWKSGRLGNLFACACWLGICLVGGYAAMRYDFQPGRLGAPQTILPAGTTLAPSAGQVTVFAFVHPRCVCTAATVKQLILSLQKHPDAQLIAVVFVPPAPESTKEWEGGEHAQALARVPGAFIVPDPGGTEAKRFGALTSGAIVVYDRLGRETFRGGITDRRGGEEDNPGLRQFERALVEDARTVRASSPPVFGCPVDAR